MQVIIVSKQLARPSKTNTNQVLLNNMQISNIRAAAEKGDSCGLGARHSEPAKGSQCRLWLGWHIKCTGVLCSGG